MHFSDQPARRIDKARVTLRAARPEDDGFLLDLFASTRVLELEHLPPDESVRQAFLHSQFTAQLAHYRQWFTEASYDVVLVAEEPVGRLFVLRTGSEVRVLDIAIVPEHRNAGIGTKLLNDLQAEAAAERIPVRLYVEAFNPSRRLFDRLGFVAVEEQGFHILMEWRTQLP
jgi:GNAT superfamily N-acetyltransferase